MRVLSLRLVMLLVAYLPRGARLVAIRSLAYLRYRRYHSGTRPKAANLRERLGVTPAEAEKILRRWYELHLLSIVDGIRTRALRAEDLDSVIELEGLEHLRSALSGGRGAVLTTGHVEGLTLSFTALGLLGYRPNLIRLKAHRRKRRLARWIYERYNRRLERHGCASLWMEPGGFQVGVLALNALRRNEVVISPIDLSQSTDNVVVTFFGRPALMPRGMAMLAQVARAPLLDFFVYRSEDDRLVASIGEPHMVAEVQPAVQTSATALEAQVRRHPADWSPWHVFTNWQDILQSTDSSAAAQARPSASIDADRPMAGSQIPDCDG